MNPNSLRLLLCCCIIGIWSCVFAPGTVDAAGVADAKLVYFGTYTRGKSKGIYVSRFNAETGRLEPAELAAEIRNPSFLALHPNGRFLYAVGETGKYKGKSGGSVSAFSIDEASGKLKSLNQESSRGGGPCHVIVDAAGKNVLVANYGGGNVAVLPVAADGRLQPASSVMQHKGSSVNKRRQGGPHAHGIYLDAANRFAFAPDLGLDKVLIYKFNAAKGILTPNDPPSAQVTPGSGPRHFAFHPRGRLAYAINELLCTVTAFTYEPNNGALTEIQEISTLPGGGPVQPGYSTAELMVHPSGKFLYGSNRGHNTIVTYVIDESSSALTSIAHTPTKGGTPRSFGIDPTGNWLLAANQSTDNVAVFRIDQQTGRLTPTGQSLEVGAPVCVVFR